MVITSYGRIPGFQFANKSYRWVDRDGKPVSPPTEVESLGMTTSGHVDPNVRTVSAIHWIALIIPYIRLIFQWILVKY